MKNKTIANWIIGTNVAAILYSISDETQISGFFLITAWVWTGIAISRLYKFDNK